jgi:nucleotide-binding universal stress UspA family protein
MEPMRHNAISAMKRRNAQRAQARGIMFKNIVVPVDLAEVDVAKPGIDKAVEFAKTWDGKVRLIYVRSILPITYMEFVPPDFDAQQQSLFEGKLAEVAAGVKLPSGRVASVVRLGSIYNEVLDEVTKTGADLVIIGSHRPAMASYLLGSNASTIVRHATCSVLVVRA